MQQKRKFNPKRQVAPRNQWQLEHLRAMAKRAGYGGNPEHKSRPGDYNLVPAASPRPGKTLCDKTAEFSKAKAEELLRSGFCKGMVSLQQWNGWPQNVWSVLDGEPFEAQLENREKGTYHGYPMPLADDFRQVVLKEWTQR